MRRGRWWLLAALMALVLAGCQTATVLKDGRVLLVTLGGAAIYDPAADALTQLASPPSPRAAHTATLLQDGRVLLAGGTAESGLIAGAELFDPTAGTFSATGSLLTARAIHSATLLQDGRVLVAGGGDASGDQSQPPLSSAELYDPTTGTFSATGDLGGPRAMQTATLLSDGTVLLAGGTDGAIALATAERYDPATGTFTVAGTMAGPRALHTATLLSDGSVLLVGGLVQAPNGEGDPQVLATIERYDPAAGTFTALGSLRTPRAGHAAVLLPDGRVLVLGGVDAASDPIGSAELIDPATGTATPSGDLVTPRNLPSVSLLGDGRVLVVGGDVDPTTPELANPFGSPEVYDPATGTFRALGA